MKNIISFALIILFVSCSTDSKSGGYDHGHGLSAAGGATAGALAWKLAENESHDAQIAWAAGAGLTTFAFGEYVRSQNLLTMEQKYALGYKAGQADATKIHYEMIQNLQRGNGKSVARRFATYEFPGAEKRQGVNLAPHTIKIRVEE